jgi:hypothetical protein
MGPSWSYAIPRAAFAKGSSLRGPTVLKAGTSALTYGILGGIIWTIGDLIAQAVFRGGDPMAPQVLVSAWGPPVSLPMACMVLVGLLAGPFLAGLLAARDTGVTSAGAAAGAIMLIAASIFSALLHAGGYGYPTPYQWVAGLTCPAMVGALVGTCGSLVGRRLHPEPAPYDYNRFYSGRHQLEAVEDPSAPDEPAAYSSPPVDRQLGYASLYPNGYQAQMYRPGGAASPYTDPPDAEEDTPPDALDVLSEDGTLPAELDVLPEEHSDAPAPTAPSLPTVEDAALPDDGASAGGSEASPE